MKILIAIQARSASTRLPGKIYEKIGNKTILKWVYEAALEAKQTIEEDKIFESCEVVVIGPLHDEKLVIYCAENLMPHFAPDVLDDDLVGRYHEILIDSKADAVIRLTADCPFLQSKLIVEGAKSLLTMDYVSNTKERSFMEGLDLQGATKKAFFWIHQYQKKNREHPFFDLEKDYHFEEKFIAAGFTAMNLFDLNNPICVKTSIDELSDLERARRIYGNYFKALK